MKIRPLTEYNEDARVIGEPKIGKDCWIGPFCVLDASGGLEIGDHCTIAAGTHIYTHQSEAGRCSKIERKPVKIGSNVYIGPSCIICMGITIGDGAIVGAMTFVNKDIPKGCKYHGGM
jgi:acetyltransferase-like isoleucine patch superfamily enzyme